MRVVGVRRHASDAASPGDGIADEVQAVARLGALLPEADALVVCVPLVPDTDGLLGADELARLPAHAVLVNVSRGPIIDEQALFEALQDGRLGAAGLDVWWRYPEDEPSRTATPPSRFPFHDLDNVVLSPHRGGSTTETANLRMQHLARLLHAAARGEEVPNRVDVEAGY
jgi:phosphoglycerate dehydrogenase-like enzyme